MRSPRTALAAVALASAVTASLVAGCTTGAVDAAPGVLGPAPAVSQGDRPSVRFGVDAAASSTTSGRPVRLQIPVIDVDAEVEMLGTGAAGELTPPVRPGAAGWYTGSAVPGAVGPAVLAGHVDSAAGPAVFHRLRELRAGAAVSVVVSDGRTVRYTATHTERHRKERFPTAAVYGPTPEPALRLITCGGTYDRDGTGYRDNIIVFAVAELDLRVGAA